MSEPWEWSAVDLAAGIAKREVGCVEALDSILGRIADGNDRLNAIVVDMADEARTAAEAADRAVAAGDPLGPLHGVPVTIKGNLDVAGQPNSGGVPAFASRIATADAPAVRNLRAAGAVITGLTNTPEFAIRGTTDNPLHGPTINPWDADAAPGGSSGGAGVAAAAGFGPLHQGSDIGGSLRFPAAACGVVTVKPTTCRVPAFNSTSSGDRGPLSQLMSCQGMIARHADDVAIGLEAMIRPDPRDPNCPPVPWAGPPLDGPLPVAVTTDAGTDSIHPEIAALIDRAAGQLDDAGYAVVEVSPPPIAEAFDGWFSAATTEMVAGMAEVIQRFGSPDVRQLFDWTVEAGDILDRDGYIATFGGRTGLMRDWNLFLDTHPLVLGPFMTQPQFDADFDTLDYDTVRAVLDASKLAFGINYLGLPAGVIGMDLVDGRPSGVQIIGRRYREDLICEALAAIEQRNGVMAHRLWASEQH